MTDNIRALVRYRLELADESLESAKVLGEKYLLRPSVSCSYYAMFYAVQALLATRQFGTSKYSGAIAFFDKEFVKSGIIDKNFSRWLHKAFDLRQSADYQTDYQITTEQSEITLKNAVAFVNEIKAKIAI